MKRKKDLFIKEAPALTREDKRRKELLRETKKFTLFMPKKVHREFSKRALDLDMTLHDLLIDLAYLFSVSEKVSRIVLEEARKREEELLSISPRRSGYHRWFSERD